VIFALQQQRVDAPKRGKLLDRRVLTRPVLLRMHASQHVVGGFIAAGYGANVLRTRRGRARPGGCTNGRSQRSIPIAAGERWMVGCTTMRPLHCRDGCARPAVARATPVLLVAIAWTSGLYGLTFAVVRAHYRTRLPHFDSMGGFSGAWHLMNQVAHEGHLAGLASLAALSTGWLQPAYALLLAGFPTRSPEALVSLNFVCLILAQVAVLNHARASGFSTERQLVMVALPLVPAVASGWNGGIQDFRRDSQLAVLMTGALFQSLAYCERPGPANGAYLGLLGGLTLWSRDNSAFVLAVALLPAVALASRRGYRMAGVVGRGVPDPAGAVLRAHAGPHLGALHHERLGLRERPPCGARVGLGRAAPGADRRPLRRDDPGRRSHHRRAPGRLRRDPRARPAEATWKSGRAASSGGPT
jgi:hypothetical protein